MPETPLPSTPEKILLTPEFKLLAACSWIAPPALEQDQAEKIISLCRGGIDWLLFVALVRRHGVSALACTMLCRHAGDWLPDTIKDTMKMQHIQASGQALQQLAELVRIGKLFADLKISMIPLKGVLLSYRLYGNPAMRGSCDLDVMVKPEDLDRADRLLKSVGYRCEYPGVELTERQKEHLRQHAHHYDYIHEEYGFHLELHCRSFLWTPGQAGVLWKGCHTLELAGFQFSVLRDDALLLYLCEHGARHQWFCLKWLSDVAVLFAEDRVVDWDSLIGLAERLDLKRVLAHTALMVHWVYGIRLAEPLCRLINKEQKLVALSASAINIICRPSIKNHGLDGMHVSRLIDAWLMMKLKPSLSYRLMLKEVFIAPEDFTVLSLPDRWFWLYYPLRPILWFWRKYMSPGNV